MIRASAPVAFASCLFGCALAAGCAAPGEPAARHPVVPARVTDLTARQYGNSFVLTFALPERSVDREALAEHPTIEIFRAALPPNAVPDRKTPWRLAYTIPSEQVDRYLKGEHVEFLDPLSAEDFAAAGGSSLAYKVRTRAVKARASEDSNVTVARIYPAPEAPHDVRTEVTESALVVQWADAPLPPGASSRSYRVYRGLAEAGEANPPQDVSQAKLKTPLEVAGTSPTTEFHDSHFEFGTTYLYTVRTAAQFGADLVESADSVPVVITPRDVFPPAAPTEVEITAIPATPQTPAYVELSWAISPEADLAGYAVYRSDEEGTPGDRVNTEILPSPAFRDMSVPSGRRYYYRVSALDRSGNESLKSPALAVDVP
jgi:fibronectin type 3 domain-containing protein